MAFSSVITGADEGGRITGRRVAVHEEYARAVHIDPARGGRGAAQRRYRRYTVPSSTSTVQCSTILYYTHIIICRRKTSGKQGRCVNDVGASAAGGRLRLCESRPHRPRPRSPRRCSTSNDVRLFYLLSKVSDRHSRLIETPRLLDIHHPPQNG